MIQVNIISWKVLIFISQNLRKIIYRYKDCQIFILQFVVACAHQNSILPIQRFIVEYK